MRGLLLSLALSVIVTGCVQTSELPLAENVVLIRATGLSSNWITHMVVAEQVPTQTLRRAAQATIDRGYTHFRIKNATSQATYVGNTPLRGHVMGNSVMVSGGNPITSTDIVLMIVMYREGEKGARGAIDAHFTLREINKKRP